MLFLACSTSSPTRFLANPLSTSGVLSSMAAPYLVEGPFPADFALIKAKEVDDNGNLSYTLTACNFNRLMAMAAWTVIAEAALVLKERAPGVPVAALLAATEATLLVPEHVPEMQLAG